MSIEKIPIFNYFDVYEHYKKQEIEDLTYYLIEVLEDTIESRLLFGYKFCLTFGYVLKTTDIKYKIIYFRKPLNITEVNFKSPVDKLYESKISDKLFNKEEFEALSTEDKYYYLNEENKMRKAIVNITTGLLEKGKNKSNLSKIFHTYDEAKYYALKYDGYVLPVRRTNKYEEFEEYCGIENKIVTKNRLIEDSRRLYLVKLSKEQELCDGLKPIKHMIYYNQRIKMLNQYKKMTELKLIVKGIRCDCIYYDNNCDENVIRKNFKLSNQIGNYKIEHNKNLPEKKLILENNELLKIEEFNMKIKTFDNEYDTKTINEYINNETNLFISGEYPGVGKTTLCQNFDRQALFVCPYNKLCQNMQKEGLTSITFNKTFGLYIDDDETKNTKKYDISNCKTVVFDETFLYTPERLKKLDELIRNNQNIKFISTGDSLQRDPVGFSDSEYLTKCINIIFKNMIVLKEIKRLTNEEDKIKWKKLKYDLFETKLSVEEICKKYNLNTINKMSELTTTKNIALFNKRCDYVNHHIHHNILKHKSPYYVGMELVKNGKYHKVNKQGRLYSNYVYKLVEYDDNIVILDEVEKKKYQISKGNLVGHFKLPYCLTIDSCQGMSFDEKVTIFDSNNCYTDRKYLWTALTRCRKLDDVYIFLHSKSEIESLVQSRIRHYFNNKILGYKQQDKIKNREYDDVDYITEKWIYEQVTIKNGLKCKCCGGSFYLYLNDNNEFNNNVISNITVDRIHSSLPHVERNCQILCNKCNSAKGNRYTYKF
jgi:hypothetical protein